MSGFGDAEREQIRQDLIEAARESLLRHGPKKTTIADITRPAGIAQSSFYLFFDSKGEIYLEIMHQETTKFVDEIQMEVENAENAREGFVRICQRYSAFTESNPLVRELIKSDYYGTTFREDIPQDRLREIQQDGMTEVIPFIEMLQQQTDGVLADYEPPVILGVISTVGLLALHKQEFDQYADGYYGQVRDLLVQALATGLTTAPESTHNPS